MLCLCFKVPCLLFGNTRDTSVMHEKTKCVCFIYRQPQNCEIQICSNKRNMSRIDLGGALQPLLKCPGDMIDQHGNLYQG